MQFYHAFLLLILLTESKADIDVDLMLKLQKHFRSDLILIVGNDFSPKELNFLYKKNFPDKVLLGVIDTDKSFEDDVERILISSYRNTIVVSKGINLFQKLNKVQKYFPRLMGLVIWINLQYTDDLEKAIGELYIPFNCKFFLYKHSEIIQVYQIGENSSKIYSSFATWKNKSLKLKKPDTTFQYNSIDLAGYTLNIAETLFIEFKNNDHHLWDLFSQSMNFSINYVPINHGVIYPNGTKTGLFKSLEERVIDTSPNLYVFTKERLNYFDYIFPTIDSVVKIYLKVETELNWTSYLAPFSIGVWTSILCWIITASIVIKLILRLRRVKNDFESPTLYVLRAICYQAGQLNRSASSISLQITYVMPYILAIVLTQFYSGAILSYLTVKNLNAPFRTLQDVVNDGTYKIMVVQGTQLLFYLQTDPGDEATTIRERLLIPLEKLPVRIGSGFRRLCENRYVYLCGSTGFEIRESCDLVEISEEVFKEPLGILVRKGFPYRVAMNKLLRYFQSAGLENLKKKNTIIPFEDSKEFKSLSMEIVFPIYLFYLSVAIFSVVILIFEMKFNRINF